MSTNKKKVVLSHLAVVQDGTLRLVRVDGEDGLEELAALAVGDNLKLADAVSAAVALADIVGHVGAPARSAAKAEPVPEATPLKSGEGHVTSKSIADANEQVAAKAAKKKPAPIKAKPGSVMDKLAKAANGDGSGKGNSGKRAKRPAEKRYSDADIYDLLRRAVHNEHGGMKAAEVARLLCSRYGVDYYHKDPMVKSINNRMRNMVISDLLVRNDEGYYSLPVPVADWPEMVPDGQELLADPVDNPVGSVDDEEARQLELTELGVVRVADSVQSTGDFPRDPTTPEESEARVARFGSVAGMNGLG